MPPLISKEEMYLMSSGYESDAELMSTDILEDIHDGGESRPSVNRIETRYKICGRIK